MTPFPARQTRTRLNGTRPLPALIGLLIGACLGTAPLGMAPELHAQENGTPLAPSAGSDKATGQDSAGEPTGPDAAAADPLLDDLDANLLQDLAPPPTPGSPLPAAGEPDRRLLESLGAGEDLGEEGDPLSKIASRMRIVERRIVDADTSPQTQLLQQRIVEDLDGLIDRLNQQCQKSAGGSAARQPKPGSPKPSKPGDKPAPDGTNRQGTAQSTEVAPLPLQQTLERIWGHLPPQLRPQVQNVSSEEFLPKYEQLIESYYRRLAEEPAGDGDN